MASIEQIKGSDGSGNASVATVQSSRSPGASTINVDTVLSVNPDGFMGSMGTPHTFIDPVTSEEITVISEATCVDFSGHVDGSNLEIDDIAPGYTDLGSEVGDIIIIRPTTQWSDNVASVLETAHEDDGTLKANTVDTTELVDGAVETAKIDPHAVGASRLAAIESTDLFNNTAITAATWTDYKGNQNFTVDNADSIILISISGHAQIGTAANASVTGSRIIIDSAGTPITRRLGGGVNLSATQPTNPFAGAGLIAVTGLAAGVHTIKTQMYCQNAGGWVYARNSSLPDVECFATYVTELKR